MSVLIVTAAVDKPVTGSKPDAFTHKLYDQNNELLGTTTAFSREDPVPAKSDPAEYTNDEEGFVVEDMDEVPPADYDMFIAKLIDPTKNEMEYVMV